MSVYFKVVIILLVVLIVAPSAAAASPPGLPMVRLRFDKTVYVPTDTFGATGTVTNDSGVTFRYTRLTLTLFPAVKSREALTSAFETQRPPVVRQTWFKTIGAGPTEVGFKRDLSALRLGEGVYPAELSLTLANRQTLVDRSFLVVLEPKDYQMPVALVWNLHQPERRLPDGTFADNVLGDLVANKPESQGLLQQQLAALIERPTVKVNLAVSPILAEQLSAMAAGYVWRDGERRQTVRRDGAPAVAAAGWLDGLDKVYKSEQAEILTSPYGQSPLPALAALGWDETGLDELTHARVVSQKNLALEEPPPGIYLPGLLIDKKTARWLILAKFRYAVALAGRSELAEPRRPLDFKLGRRHLTIFESDHEITQWLNFVSAEKAQQELTALLAQRLLAKNNGGLVTIAPDSAHGLPGPDLLPQLYQVFAPNPRVQPGTLVSALDQPKDKARLKSADGPLIADRSYAAKLKTARRDLLDFAAAVSPANDLRQRLERQFHVATSIDYLPGIDSRIPPIGPVYAQDIHRTVAREFAKLELAPPAKITFSTRYGKIPVAVINRTGYPIRARLRLSGKDFIFSDDKKEKVTLMPKENLISYNITAGFVGLSKLRVTIFVGDREIASRQIEVRVSNFLRYLVVTVTSLLIAGTGILIYLRSRRR